MKKLFLISATVLLVLGFFNWGLWIFSGMFLIGYIAAKSQEHKDRINGIYHRQLKRHRYGKNK